MKTYAAIAGVVALTVAILFGIWQYGQIRGLRDQLRTAKTQAVVDTATTKEVERVLRTEVTIHQQAQGAIENVQQAPGASDPLPPAVRGSVLSGIDGMRHTEPASDVPRAVPTR